LEELELKKKYDAKPRVWGGPEASTGVGWSEDDYAPADTVQTMIDEGIKSLEKERPRPELQKAVKDGDCRISYMSVHADSKAILDWVNRHLDDVEGVQPIVDFLDKNMPELGPTQALKEGE
jgi:chemotaxis regulatin CheY-phosphate phosphatase CheZ